MAIAADIIVSSGVAQSGKGPTPIMELPPQKVHRVNGAGTVDLTLIAGNIYQSRMGKASDSVWVRVQADSDSTQAASGDDKSFRLDAGDIFSFGIKLEDDASQYEIDIRVVS